MTYNLEIKQIVDYPRCRVYRDFLRDIMGDREIHTNGNSYLFYFMVLCSYANYRASYRKLEGISYLVGPGEWVCKLTGHGKGPLLIIFVATGRAETAFATEW